MEICTYNSSLPIDYTYQQAWRNKGIAIGSFLCGPITLGGIIAVKNYMVQPQVNTGPWWLTQILASITFSVAIGSTVGYVAGTIVDWVRHYNPFYLIIMTICTDVAQKEIIQERSWSQMIFG